MPKKFFGDNTQHRMEIHSKLDNSRNLGKLREDDERIMEAYRLQNNGQKSIKLDKNTKEGREAIKAINNLVFGKNDIFQVETNNNLNKRAETCYVNNIDIASPGEILDDIRTMDAALLVTISNNAESIVRDPTRNTDDWYHFCMNINQINTYKINPSMGYADAVRAYRNIETRYMNGEYNTSF
jgi:hypothetical protein